jgi:very-short-patch-repair endonuclease
VVRFRTRPTHRAQELRNNATDIEKKLWRHLSRRQLNGFKFSRQMPVGPFICDFMCREAALVVELDGGQHDTAAGGDAERTRFIESEGYRVIRFWNNDVMGNVDGVLSEILAALELPSPPAPPASGRGE